METRLALNLLAILGCGVFTGVMLNIGLVFGAYWRSLPPADFLAWFGANSHLIGRTIPFVAGPAAIGLLGSLWLAAAGGRLPWLAALAAIVLLFALTAAYHLPANAAFAARAVPLGEVAAALDRWLLLHWLRVALGAVATVACVLAVAR